MALDQILREIIARLDVHGKGFRTNDAAHSLFTRACEGRNDIPPLLARLARRGAREGVAGFRHMDMGADEAPDPTNRIDHWISTIAALHEGTDAVRKQVLRMTYPEFLQMIALRERKAAQMRELAKRASTVLLQCPEWAANPAMTLADVLGGCE